MPTQNRYSRLYQCDGKNQFDTYKQAKDRAKYLSIKYSEQLDFYRCTWCQKYHIGHRVYWTDGGILPEPDWSNICKLN